MQGWISLYREILSNPIVCKDTHYFTIWVFLLLEATHTEQSKIFKGNKIILNRGQLITGRKKIAEKFKIQESKVQRVLKCFETERMIEQQSSNKNRLITLTNYNKYQLNEQQIKQLVNNKRTTTEQQLNTNNNVNKEKNEKKVIKKQAKKVYFDNEELNTLFYEFILMRKKIKKPMTDKAIELAIGKLNKQSDNIKTQMLEYSIMNNYQGLFIPKEQTESKQERKFGNG